MVIHVDQLDCFLAHAEACFQYSFGISYNRMDTTVIGRLNIDIDKFGTGDALSCFTYLIDNFLTASFRKVGYEFHKLCHGFFSKEFID